MVFEVGKILGQLGGEAWGQVHDFTGSGEKLAKRGRLVVGISATQVAARGMEMVTVGREMLARVHELYFGQLEADPLTALRQAANTVSEEFSPVEVVAIAVVGEAMYVVVIEGGGVWAKLEPGKEGWIVNPMRPTTETVALSGWLQPGSVVVGGSSQFWQVVTVGAVRAAVTNSTEPGEAAETLATVVHGNDASYGAVGMIIRAAPRKTPVTLPSDRVLPASGSSRPSFSDLKAKLASWVPKASGPIFISHGDKTVGRKHTMWLGVGFLILLLLLVGGWQWRKSYLSQKSSLRQQQIAEVVHKFNEAQSLTDLNPVRSRQLLEEVNTDLTSLKEQKIQDSQLAQIESNLGQVLGAASGVKTTNPQVVMDLEWLRPGMRAAKLVLGEGKLAALDTEADRLIVVDPAKKSGQIVAGKNELGAANLLATYPGKIAVTSDKGLLDCTWAGVCKVVVTDNPGGLAMAMFAGNVYVLTPSGVNRYQVTETGYSSAQAWLASSEDTTIFTKSVSMAIDAFIWVTTQDSQILKYAHGIKENFALTDLDKPLAASPIIYTDADADNLYLLDKLNGRVVVVDKAGAYKAQYPTDIAKSASDLVVDEHGGKLYLLSGSKIWQVDL